MFINDHTQTYTAISSHDALHLQDLDGAYFPYFNMSDDRQVRMGGKNEAAPHTMCYELPTLCWELGSSLLIKRGNR